MNQSCTQGESIYTIKAVTYIKSIFSCLPISSSVNTNSSSLPGKIYHPTLHFPHPYPRGLGLLRLWSRLWRNLQPSCCIFVYICIFILCGSNTGWEALLTRWRRGRSSNEGCILSVGWEQFLSAVDKASQLIDSVSQVVTAVRIISWQLSVTCKVARLSWHH